MFFVLSKLLDVLLAPLTWAFLLVAASTLPRARRGPAGARLLAAGLGLLYVFSLDPVAWALQRGCEGPTVARRALGPPYDAVVLLSGLLDERATLAHGRPALNDNVERLTETFTVLRDGTAKLAIVTGGSVDEPMSPEATESAVLARILVDWGIAPERVIVEPTAKNTQENAARTAEIVRARGLERLLLVTSAFHMPRAYGCFRAVGLDPDTLPVDYRTAPLLLSARSVLPRADHLARSTAALRELAGRVVYRVRGAAR